MGSDCAYGNRIGQWNSKDVLQEGWLSSKDHPLDVALGRALLETAAEE